MLAYNMHEAIDFIPTCYNFNMNTINEIVFKSISWSHVHYMHLDSIIQYL